MEDHPMDEEEVNELKVFVGNLPFTATTDEVEDIFSKIGEVVGINLREDRDTNRPKGFGFVTFSSAESATEAIALLDGYIMDGRTLTVSPCLKRGARSNAEKEKEKEDQEWMTVPTKRGGGKAGGKSRGKKAGKQKSWTSWAVPPDPSVLEARRKQEEERKKRHEEAQFQAALRLREEQDNLE